MIAVLCGVLCIIAGFQETSSLELAYGENVEKEIFGTQSFTSSIDSNPRASILSGTASSSLIGQIKPTASLAQTNFIVNNSTVGICICVTSGSCSLASGGGSSTDGSGLIDPRIVNNPSSVSTVLTPISSGITPAVINQNFCQTGLERCCPTSGYSCGIRYPPISGAKPPSQGQAAFGAYPWQVVLLAANDAYQGSGVLIDHVHVLTAAHKVSAYLTNGQQLKVRLGEWDASSNTEPIAAQEFFVSRIFIHPQFVAANLKNGIAILRLSTAVPLGQVPTVSTACLPSNTLPAGTKCFVGGWGRNDFSNNGAYQAIMKDVEIPLVETNNCQTQMRATRLGANFVLDAISFMCAGGEAGKDACVGDGGSPLVCLNGGRWYVMGLVSWGIGCGTSNVPGVYINVANFLQWIQSTTRS